MKRATPWSQPEQRRAPRQPEIANFDQLHFLQNFPKISAKVYVYMLFAAPSLPTARALFLSLTEEMNEIRRTEVQTACQILSLMALVPLNNRYL